MIAVDTNVLLRALVDDPENPAQCAAARRLLGAAARVRISAAVFLETLWTLSRSYGFPRREIARTGNELLAHPRYQVHDSELFSQALARFAASNVSLADALALEDASVEGALLYTFDRKLAKQENARLLEG